jgi:hypothetical protein
MDTNLKLLMVFPSVFFETSGKIDIGMVSALIISTIRHP